MSFELGVSSNIDIVTATLDGTARQLLAGDYGPAELVAATRVDLL